MHGYWVVWHKNGQKHIEATFINGEGDYAIGGTSWNKYGQILEQTKLNEGKIVSVERTYFDKTVSYNGKKQNQIKSEKNYVDEMKHGKGLRWYSNGQCVY